MTSRVFISHSGQDSELALSTAEHLRESGIEPVIDREELRLGDSFLSFMEEALTTSDYCLLLWSVAAAGTKWVQMEWEAALHRSVSGARGFLVVGCLDDHPLPALLAPRLFVALHPELAPGLGELVRLWTNDRDAGRVSGRPVAENSALAATDAGGDTLYVTSELFAVTVPVSVDLRAPAGLLVDRVVRDVGLPAQLDHDGRVGVRFAYHLAVDDRALESGQPLRDQGVEPHGVVWLKSEMTPFATTAPEAGRLEAVTFRGANDPAADVRHAGRKELLTVVRAAGLGPRPASRT